VRDVPFFVPVVQERIVEKKKKQGREKTILLEREKRDDVCCVFGKEVGLGTLFLF